MGHLMWSPEYHVRVTWCDYLPSGSLTMSCFWSFVVVETRRVAWGGEGRVEEGEWWVGELEGDCEGEGEGDGVGMDTAFWDLSTIDFSIMCDVAIRKAHKHVTQAVCTMCIYMYMYIVCMQKKHLIPIPLTVTMYLGTIHVYPHNWQWQILFKNTLHVLYHMQCRLTLYMYTKYTTHRPTLLSSMCPLYALTQCTGSVYNIVYYTCIFI